MLRLVDKIDLLPGVLHEIVQFQVQVECFPSSSEVGEADAVRCLAAGERRELPCNKRF